MIGEKSPLLIDRAIGVLSVIALFTSAAYVRGDLAQRSGCQCNALIAESKAEFQNFIDCRVPHVSRFRETWDPQDDARKKSILSNTCRSLTRTGPGSP